MIVDHHCTDLSAIPGSWIVLAKETFRVGYTHTSHGSQIIDGAQAMKGSPGSTYYFTPSSSGLVPGLFMNDYWAGSIDLGSGGSVVWRDATIGMLQQSNNDRNVVMWSWCGGVSVNTASDIIAYLTAMDSLERRYPSVKFVYMTGHLDGSGSGGNLNLRNEQIRAYCRTNDKILFDFADIESYDPDGPADYMALKANDNCDYDSDGNGSLDKNWAADWVGVHPTSELTLQASTCASCAHSQQLNCILKARAFWWMMARLAGWDTPMPVQIASFSASSNEMNKVVLTWTTLSETNNLGFFVERRDADGQEFMNLSNGFVPGHGTTLVTNRYEFIDNSAFRGRHEYRLRQVDLDGTCHRSDPVLIDVLTSVGEERPARFALGQNFPNPFNPSTQISFELPTESFVNLTVYDLLGRGVATIVDGIRSSGIHKLEFNALGLSSGVYVYRLTMRPTAAPSTAMRVDSKIMDILK
jgi:hypothetical protein